MGPRRIASWLGLVGIALSCASFAQPNGPALAADAEPDPIEIYQRYRSDRDPKVRLTRPDYSGSDVERLSRVSVVRWLKLTQSV